MVDTQKRNKRQYAWQKENTDRINFTMPKGTKDQIIQAATLLGLKPAEFIREAIAEKIEKVNALKKSSVFSQDVKTEI